MKKNKLQSQNRFDWNMDSTHSYFAVSVCKDEPYKRPDSTVT